MRSESTVRTVSTVALVVIALLGTAFSIGRSLVPEQAPPGASATGPDGGTPHFADQPPPATTEGSPPVPSTGAAPEPTSSTASPDGTEVPGEEAPTSGPYGARISTGTAQVALTFDDGPDPQYTPQALELLRQYDVKATFCLVGENAQNHPDLVRAIAADGHTLCNHSWNHDIALGSRSRATIQADLLRTNEAIRAAVPNAPISYFRQPGGAWTYPVVSVARELGMTSLHWTVDPQDWEQPGAVSIADTVTSGTAAGSIVLLHDAGGNRQGTVDALRAILPNLTGRFRLEALPNDAT